ncbi:retinitis pigmentosa GTPase regulator b isoform X1 [Chelmon rostratus]|uniref:retinitis pigmentosa GTPase regulator b isoform X1 n=1 Tax=Chelmon rostratus TaxID=109905 RepID=UPI001BE8E0C5|nr:retinitis pigmentosa GTPase regulator b isoform X1 [Chelmon rostratus]
MAGEAEDDIPESGAVFTFGKSKFADNIPSKFWLKNDVPLKIACGDEHTALITENGKLFMFGSNNWGQLGLGSKATVNKPTCVKALKSERVHLVACGRNHTLICTAEGKVLASGGNSEGQLGLGDCEERTSFQTIHTFDSHGPIKMLAAGSNTSAALTASGKLFMWGDNTEGQIGLGKESHATSPQEVSVGRPISWVSCGYYHSAFVTVEGALYTFGERDSGKLGLGTEQLPRHRVPQLVKSIKQPVVQVACGGGHTVALAEDDLFTFGLGQFGQLGHGTFTFESRLPRPVEHFRRGRVCQVTCGENHTAVVTDGGLLYTFGDGRHGKLGLGDENFTNQFKPTLCSRFLHYDVQAVTCGGCHMAVLARPRDRGRGGVTLEADDVTEDFLEKPYVELLGDTADSSALQRSLSARVRRRERERSPDQFGAMFCTLPTMTPGYLHPPLPISSQTVPPRLPPPELTHRKVLNGTHQHGSAGSNHQGQAGGEADSIVESLTDADSVKGLGETTDFLNMTHVMKMDPRDQTLTLSPVQKKKGKHGNTSKGQKETREGERKLLKQSGFSSTPRSHKKTSEAVSPRRALPTELLRGHGARSPASRSPQRPKTSDRNKENLILAVEELQRKPSKNTSVGDFRKAAIKRRLGPAQGESQLIEVGRKLSDSKQSPETRKTVSGESAAAKVKQAQPKAVSVKSKPMVVGSQHAGVSSAGKRSDTGSPGFHLRGALNEESSGGGRLHSEVKKNSKFKEKTDFSKKSKDEKNKKEAQSKKGSEHAKGTEEEASDLSLLAGTASLAAGSLLLHEAASRSHFSSASPSPSESSRGVMKHSVRKMRADESESYDFSNKSTVSINIVPAPESSEVSTSQDEKEASQDEKETSQDEKETSQDEKETSQDEKETSQDEKETSQDEKEASQDEKEVSQDEKEASQDEKETSQDEKETSQDEKETSQEESEEEQTGSATAKQEKGGQRTSTDVSEEEEEEDVSHSIEKATEEEDEKDSDTLQPEEESETDEEEEGSGDEEEEDEGSGTAGSDDDDETEGKESEGSDVEEEEESDDGLSHETESKGGESENEEGEEEEGEFESEGEEEECESESSKSSDSEESDVESEAEEGEEEEEQGQSSAEEEEEESSEEEESENEEESEEEVEEEEEDEAEAEEESAEEEAEEEKDSEEEATEEEEEEVDDKDEEEEEEETEEEEEEEEEEEVVQKKKSEVKRQSAKSQRSGVKGQAAGESEEFWDDVLPQYLNLK